MGGGSNVEGESLSCQLHFRSARKTKKNASAQGSLKFLAETNKIIPMENCVSTCTLGSLMLIIGGLCSLLASVGCVPLSIPLHLRKLLNFII